MNPYIPHTQEDIKEMLDSIGVEKVEELFEVIPKDLRDIGAIDIPQGLSEIEVRDKLRDLNSKNNQGICFLGQGAYDHYIPSSIASIISRSEFLTSYTPYQPEISQGTLQYIFEYQSMICELTGLDVSNASVYDGSNAVVEAMMMCCNYTKKRKIYVSSTVFDTYKRVIETYSKSTEIEVIYIPSKDGYTDFDSLKMNDDIAGLIIQSPNKYGLVENVSKFSQEVHKSNKSLLIQVSNPNSFSVFRSAGENGADVCVGEAQSLGIPLQFGGPYIGYMAVKKELMRKLPGRICGETIDRNGNRAYVLTLTAREQHIRRSKATSNICSNQGIQTLAVSAYLSIMGFEGLKDAYTQSINKAHYLYNKLISTGKFEDVYGDKFTNEFVLKSKVKQEILEKELSKEGYFACSKVEEDPYQFAIAVTENRSKQEMDKLVELMEDIYDKNI